MTIDQILHILQDHGLLIDSLLTDTEQIISGRICVDNRQVKKGDVFVCIKGQNFDGHTVIPTVIQNKPALIISENELNGVFPAIQVKSSRKATALLAKLYYNDPSSKFRIIGITGTNGKTTTSMLLFKALRDLGFAVGLIGTLGYDINDSHYETHHTTPDILELNQIFACMAEQKVQYVVMEVSSHALALDRVYGIEFDFCLFTNLSREHLDFHKNMEDYGATKKILFDGAVAHKSVAVINIDDSFGSNLYHELLSKDAYVFSVGSSGADYTIRTDHIARSMSWELSRFALQYSDGVINIRSLLIGRFNIANLALCAATLSLMGFERRQVEQGINSTLPVRGRFERIPNDRHIGVFVDYAHTPDALENILRASRELEHQRVLCLFGAGGDRDQGKRPLMLKTALQYADAVIITDDNPRSENPNAIIKEIVRDSELWLPWWIIRNRREAIYAILRLAQPGDIVLICGKGHEAYQEIQGIRHHFDDAEVVQDFFALSPSEASPEDELILPVDNNLLDILCGVELPDLDNLKDRCYSHLSTDSRAIKNNSLFFALKGESFDGNDYLESVLRSGSNAAVGTKDIRGFASYYQVPDSRKIMANLHHKYLMMFDIFKVALTGSTGKSTTKEMLAQVFSSEYMVLKTEANENNLIGLCKTIARIRPDHKVAVFELGTNAFGEIGQLSDVCAPNVGIILNIGPSHLEFLESEDGVFREKSSLFERPLELRLFDADDPRFSIYSEIGMGVGISEQAEFRIEKQIVDEVRSTFLINGIPFAIPYSTPHNIKNAAFAISMGLFKGIAPEQINASLSHPVSLDMRLQLRKSKGQVLLVDCYNANPVSMQSAIEYWLSIKKDSPHVAILGDMLELGESSSTYHSMIAAILAEQGVEELITVGHHSAGYHKQDSVLIDKHYLSVEELLASKALDDIRMGSVILIKGSHSIHLEKILTYFNGE